ncbi:FtsB family cell division protein [Clostridium sp. Cult2]|uniref:FtsB family cell division protein n=1 Tax=Clostridium sp. Cult2 TaxID=2079003 RepID=UPI001F328428|nr:septum formation initiator family protein [Clostridium sp. Cult2]MCF6464558.1 cell division protein FtsB [Clostridium sp. Cult2]
MKKKGRRKSGFRLIHLIILLIVFWIGKTLISQSIMIKDLNSKRIKEEDEITLLKEEIEELSEEIENKDSLTFVEKIAREDLRMVRPREIIYIDKNKDKSLFNFFRK